MWLALHVNLFLVVWYSIRVNILHPLFMKNKSINKVDEAYLSIHWKWFEFLHPFLANHNALMFILFNCWVVSLFQGMINEILNYSWMKCIGNIEHIISITLSTFRICFGKIFFLLSRASSLSYRFFTDSSSYLGTSMYRTCFFLMSSFYSPNISFA